MSILVINEFNHRNNYGLAQRQINQLLDQEGGCTVEELLEQEFTVSQCRNENQRLIEFLSQKTTLQKLIKYATMRPEDCESHDIAHKFPFAAAEILTSSKTLSTSLIEGGTLPKPDDEESGDEKKSQEDAEEGMTKIVRDSLNETNVSVS